MSVPFWLSKHLAVVDPEGNIQPPGGDRGQRFALEDKGECTLIARGDAFDVYFSRADGVLKAQQVLDAPAALCIARWVIWWWIATQWCGVKTWLWNWSLRKVLDDGKAKRRATKKPQRLGERRGIRG